MEKLVTKKTVRCTALFLTDVLLINFCVFLSLTVRFTLEGTAVPVTYLQNAISMAPAFTICTVALFYCFRLYKDLWAYASISEAIRVFAANVVALLIYFVLSKMLHRPLPNSCYVMLLVFITACTEGNRFFYRILCLLRNEYRNRRLHNCNIMLIGAGEAGSMLLREINSSQELCRSCVVCVIDDDKAKQNRYIAGVRVVGGRDDILNAAKEYQVDQIIFAIPSVSAEVRRQVLDICKQTSCTLKTVPGMYQLVNGEVKLSNVRSVELADLLGREPVKLDLKQISGCLRGRTVLVTGAGGSIGSELCRQIADRHPKCLILLDIHENNTYYIQNELKRHYPDLNVEVLIGSIRDVDRMEYVFSTFRPELVYHAAAHKHVPLMENSPNEAVKNNVFGTLNVVRMADRYGAKRFVMISTDKAVNPTNIMGATKRICEMIIQTYNIRSKTEYVAVRFGNVLGSSGSVIPIFQKQIEEGGPVTVTHPDIIRYFMTIPEAVSLVLQAGAFAKGGEIFILDMGEPVKILTLAENMIRLSGLVPGKDIQIEFCGLRPGEKMQEELLMAEEGLSATENQQIYVGRPLDINERRLYRQLDHLQKVMPNEDVDIREIIKKIVPTYQPSEQSMAVPANQASASA